MHNLCSTLKSGFILIVALLSFSAYSATIYIDPSSMVTPHYGTQSNPYTAWSEVTIASNNTYLQKCGTAAYEQVTFAAVSNVTLGAYGTGAKPKIDGSATRSYGIYFYGNTSNVKIENFEICNTLSAGIYLSGSAYYVIRDNYIHNINCTDDKMPVSGTLGFGILVNYNNAGGGLICFNNIKYTYADGIGAHTLTYGITAQNNTIEFFGNDAIDVLGSHNAIIEGNECRNSFFGTKGEANSGIKAGGNAGAGGDSNIVRYNWCHGIYNYGIFNRNATNNVYYGNACYDNGQNYNLGIADVSGAGLHISYNYSIDANYGDGCGYDVYMPELDDVAECNNNIWTGSPTMKIHNGGTYTTLSSWQSAYWPFDTCSTFTDTPHPFMRDSNTALLLYIDENSGATTKDWGGKNHDATMNGMAWADTGKYIHAAQFSGNSGSYISVPDHNDFSFGDGSGNDQAFSISAWIYLDEQRVCHIISKRNGSSNCEWELSYNNTYGIYFILYANGSNGASMGKYTNNTLSTGQWVYVAASYDGSKTRNGMKIFINGVEDTACGNVGSSTYAGMSNTSANVNIGSYNNGVSALFKGKIDHARIQKGNIYTTDFDNFLP